jgi:hypothetical protein
VNEETMFFSRLAFVRAADARATACVLLAAAATLLAGLFPVVAFLLDSSQPGGSQGQVAVRFLYGPYAGVVAAALALFSIYCGLVRRYLVGSTEARVLVGILLSLAVLTYLAYDLGRALWE